jgi:hypothetical protein
MSKSTMISFRVSDKELDLIKWAANFREISISQYLRECVMRESRARIRITDVSGQPPVMWRFSA